MSVVVITGSNSGFGFHGALEFARNGDIVYATMRDTKRGDVLQSAAAAENLSVNVRKLDVTNPESFPSLIDEIESESGGIDVLVNNAGMLRAGTAEDTSEESLREVMETNFFGPVLLNKVVLPYMRQRQKGCIIMVSSLSGLAGLPGDFSYTASKFALEGATESMRHEVDRWGIKVALIEAGMYSTEILAPSVGVDGALPSYYDSTSPYGPLMEAKLKTVRERLPDAFDPSSVGALFVEIAESDGSRLRWPADSVAKKVLATMFGHDDAGRDEFLKNVADSTWWSEGKNSPD